MALFFCPLVPLSLFLSPIKNVATLTGNDINVKIKVIDCLKGAAKPVSLFFLLVFLYRFQETFDIRFPQLTTKRLCTLIQQKTTQRILFHVIV